MRCIGGYIECSTTFVTEMMGRLSNLVLNHVVNTKCLLTCLISVIMVKVVVDNALH